MKVQSTEKERVVVLLRASSKQQTDREHDFDIPQQKSILLPFVESKGWDLVKVFTEGGVSGFKVSANDRDAIQDIKKMADRREFDILVIYMSDRLGRIADETPLIVSYLNQRGITVFSYTEGEISAKDHTSKLITYIRYWQAEGESRKTSQRVSDAIVQAVTEGRYRGGATAYGYKMVNNGRNNYKGKPVLDITVDEDGEAPVVRLIYFLARERNMGCWAIAKYLNDNGYKTRHGGLWTNTQVRQILTNPIYKGYYELRQKKNERGNPKVVSPFMPELVIIPEEEWNATQEVMDKRATRKKGIKNTNYGSMLLAGLMFCGYCGEKMTSFQGKSKTVIVDGKEERTYIPKYRCRSVRYPTENPCQGQSTYSAKKVERVVIDALKKYISTLNTQELSVSYLEKVEEQIKIAKNELSRLLAAQTRTVKELSALKDEVVKSLIGESRFDSSMLQELLAKKELEVKSSTEQIENKERELDGLTSSRNSVFELNSKMQSWDTDFEDQEVDGQKAMLYQVVDRIDIYRDRVEIHVNIKMDMYENGLSDRLQVPTSELITVSTIIEDNNNLPMVACETDKTVLSGQSIIGGVNSVSLAVLKK